MSYMRSPYPLEHFYGITESYVFPHTSGFVEDYGDSYHNNPSFIELIGRFVRDATGDEEYSDKLIRVLAKKLGCDHLLRDHFMTYEERKAEEKMLENVSSGKIWHFCNLLENLDYHDPTDIGFEPYLVLDALHTHISHDEFEKLYGTFRMKDAADFTYSFYEE